MGTATKGKSVDDTVAAVDKKDDKRNQLIDYTWKIVGRYDFYIGSTNTKAALLVTFCTFVLGSLVLKWTDFLSRFNVYPKLHVAAGISVALSALAAAAAIVYSFRAIHPFLKSARKPGTYHSNLFFIHVSEHATAEDYAIQLLATTEDQRVQDLAKQAHALAQGLSKKMTMLQKATIFTIISLVGIVGFIVCLFITTLI